MSTSSHALSSSGNKKEKKKERKRLITRRRRVSFSHPPAPRRSIFLRSRRCYHRAVPITIRRSEFSEGMIRDVCFGAGENASGRIARGPTRMPTSPKGRIVLAMGARDRSAWPRCRPFDPVRGTPAITCSRWPPSHRGALAIARLRLREDSKANVAALL